MKDKLSGVPETLETWNNKIRFIEEWCILDFHLERWGWPVLVVDHRIGECAQYLFEDGFDNRSLYNACGHIFLVETFAPLGVDRGFDHVLSPRSGPDKRLIPWGPLRGPEPQVLTVAGTMINAHRGQYVNVR